MTLRRHIRPIARAAVLASAEHWLSEGAEALAGELVGWAAGLALAGVPRRKDELTLGGKVITTARRTVYDDGTNRNDVALLGERDFWNQKDTRFRELLTCNAGHAPSEPRLGELMAATECLHVVDVTGDDPDDWRFVHCGDNWLDPPEYRTIGEIAFPALGAQARQTYMEAWLSGEPVANKIMRTRNGKKLGYVQDVVPAGDTIYIGIRRDM